jgi:serine phosphatase RsbU (regulator of sigma subunit)
MIGRSARAPEVIVLNGHPHLDAVLGDLLRASHLLEPDELPAQISHHARRLGATDVLVLLVDYEQRTLCRLNHPTEPPGEPIPVDGTVIGRAFRTMEHSELEGEDSTRLVLPLVNGTHRIGVFVVTVASTTAAPPEAPPSPAIPQAAPSVALEPAQASTADWRAYAALVADLIIAKSSYGDTITVTQRRRPAALRAEAQRLLLPPLTLISPRLLVSGMLMPSYEVAGDAFDYALNGDILHIAILDAMGHSLSATLTATVAMAAYRNSRRGGASLVEAWGAADSAVAAEFEEERFATGVLGELDLRTGRLRSVSAGHAPALVVRGNRVVARCADEPTLPMGLGGDVPAVTDTQLEPGDRLLLFTDGVVEARSQDGEFFGEERLVEQLDRALDTDLPAPEAVRLLIHAVAEHQSGSLRDDATLMLVEWRGRDKERAAPQAE